MVAVSVSLAGCFPARAQLVAEARVFSSFPSLAQVRVRGLREVLGVLEPQISGTGERRQPTLEALDVSTLITPVCLANEGNTFVVTGQGGVPLDPSLQLRGDRIWVDTTIVDLPDPTPVTANTRSQPPTPEATGWVRQSGAVELVSDSGSRLVLPGSVCGALRSPVLNLHPDLE
jgi:hypothetical protein